MVKISAVIITYNEEKNIARCIDSVQGLADETVVVDSFSTDNTKAICLQKSVRFIENAFEGYAVQKNFAVRQASYRHILSLDADECLSGDLYGSIQKVKSDWRSDGYSMNRLNSYDGKWIRTCGWYPDSKIRLWDREKGSWHGEFVHELVKMNAGATVGHLAGDLYHYGYTDALQLLKRTGQYADLSAKQMALRKYRTSLFRIVYKTCFAFFKSYILKRGIFDGYEGLLISYSIASGVFYKYSKLLELNRSASTHAQT